MTSFRGKSRLIFTSNPFEELQRQCPSNVRIALCTYQRLAEIYESEFKKLKENDLVEIFMFPANERNKSLATVEKLSDRLQERKFGRKDTIIIAFGGGIVGDVVGFLASIYLRGVPYLQVPTTLLAMVDSSIGGKTGVNTKYGKNMLGSFADPEAIIISSLFLRSLPEREISNGLAEMVKHGVLDGLAHLQELEKNIPAFFARDERVILKLIKKSIQVKLRHVRADAIETKGLRSFLNFGHTVGHAIEKASEYKIPHGSAIAIGMVLESGIAEKALGFGGKNALIRILEKCRLPTRLPEGMRLRDLREFMIQDKKNERSQIAFAIPREFGKMVTVLNPKF